jgi:hypothetical protein
VRRFDALVTRWLVPAVISATLLGCGTAAGVSDQTEGGTPQNPTKVSADLVQLYEAARSGRTPRDERVVIDAVASGDVTALKADLEGLGMQDAVAFGRIVSGRLPVSAISALNGLASLQFARPAHATTHPGHRGNGTR